MRVGTRRIVSLSLVVAAASACGSSPSPMTPSGGGTGTVVNLAGVWTGTLESSNFPTKTVTLTAVQGGNCVDGAWTTASSDWNGAISGFAAADSYSGQISFERTADGGGKCSAVGNITGPAGPNSLRWTSSGLDPVGSCTGDTPKTIVLTLNRTGG
jgi:hypothetical protein